MAKPKSQMTASKVLDVLAEKHFKTPAHAMLREVSNGTGTWSDRRADALVVSLWPSRGVWFGGVEVKVSRSDWKSELDNPAKSDAVQRFCDFWWVATPAGIVLPGELPETWGHIEVGESSCRLVKEAPRLTPEPLAPEFVASVLRNHMTSDDQRVRQLVAEAKAAVREECGIDRVRRLEVDLSNATYEKTAAEKRLKELRDQLAEFQASTGVDAESWRGTAEFKAAVEAARSLQGFHLSHMAAVLAGAAERLREAERAIADAKSDSQAAE
jgi:hypothetical protein